MDGVQDYQQKVPVSLRAGARKGLDVLISAVPGSLLSQA